MQKLLFHVIYYATLAVPALLLGVFYARKSLLKGHSFGKTLQKLLLYIAIASSLTALVEIIIFAVQGETIPGYHGKVAFDFLSMLSVFVLSSVELFLIMGAAASLGALFGKNMAKSAPQESKKKQEDVNIATQSSPA